MLWLAALALTAQPPQSATPQRVRATVQAQATVRIISATRIRFDGHPSANAPPASEGLVHSEGNAQPARLIEFE